MDKNYAKYMAVILLFSCINPSFSMDNSNNKKNGYSSWELGVIAALAALYITYPILPGVGEIQAFKYEDVSPKTQEWAKNVLQECGIKDVDKIPLKKEKYGNRAGWAAAGSHFIIVPNNFNPVTCSRKECLQSKQSLKHEVKHVQNYDEVKSRALQVGTIALGSWLIQEKPLLTIPMIPIGYGVNMAYCKYQEGEADRFACEKATSREELEAGRDFFLEIRKSCTDSVLSQINEITSEFEVEELEKNLEKVKDKLSYIDSFRANVGLRVLKRMKHEPNNLADNIVDALEFTLDREHPSLKSRAAMKQDYINKWDEKYKQQPNIFEMNKRS